MATGRQRLESWTHKPRSVKTAGRHQELADGPGTFPPQSLHEEPPAVALILGSGLQNPESRDTRLSSKAPTGGPRSCQPQGRQTRERPHGKPGWTLRTQRRPEERNRPVSRAPGGRGEKVAVAASHTWLCRHGRQEHSLTLPRSRRSGRHGQPAGPARVGAVPRARRTGEASRLALPTIKEGTRSISLAISTKERGDRNTRSTRLGKGEADLRHAGLCANGSNPRFWQIGRLSKERPPEVCSSVWFFFTRI